MKKKKFGFKKLNTYLQILFIILDKPEIKQNLSTETVLSLLFNVSKVKRAVEKIIIPISEESDKMLTDSCKKNDKGKPIKRMENGVTSYDIEDALIDIVNKNIKDIQSNEYEVELISLDDKDAITISYHTSANCTDFIMEHLTTTKK